MLTPPSVKVPHGPKCANTFKLCTTVMENALLNKEEATLLLQVVQW